MSFDFDRDVSNYGNDNKKKIVAISHPPLLLFNIWPKKTCKKELSCPYYSFTCWHLFIICKQVQIWVHRMTFEQICAWIIKLSYNIVTSTFWAQMMNQLQLHENKLLPTGPLWSKCLIHITLMYLLFTGNCKPDNKPVKWKLLASSHSRFEQCPRNKSIQHSWKKERHFYEAELEMFFLS